MKKIALQLYSIKELTQQDFLGTLEKVAGIGYNGVEFAGFFDTPAKELKAHLDACGLKAAGAHIPLDQLNDRLDETMEYALEIGNPHIICPWLAEDQRGDADSYKALAEKLNHIGEKARSNGLSLGYHNHDFEFQAFDGAYALDILMQNTEPDNLFLELDTFWAAYSDVAPAAYIRKYGKRAKLLHIKEMVEKGTRLNTELGKGLIDIRSIVEAGKDVDSSWFIVEQENFTIPQLQSIEESYLYLSNLLSE